MSMLKTGKSVSAKIYTKEFYLAERQAFKTGLIRSEIPQRLLSALALAKIKKGMRALDVGTGRGELAIKSAEAGSVVKAIDYSPVAIKMAKESLERVKKEVAKRVIFQRMNAKKIAYPDKSFDLVFMIDFIEHLYPGELRKVFLEIKRLIKPGGRIIIHTPNAWLIKPLCLLAGTFFPWWKKHKMHVNEQSFFSLKNNLRLLGGKSRLFFSQKRSFFTEAVYGYKKAPFWAKKIANVLDKIFENQVLSFLIYQTPVAFFLGTHLLAVVKIPFKEG